MATAAYPLLSESIVEAVHLQQRSPFLPTLSPSSHQRLWTEVASLHGKLQDSRVFERNLFQRHNCPEIRLTLTALKRLSWEDPQAADASDAPAQKMFEDLRMKKILDRQGRVQTDTWISLRSTPSSDLFTSSCHAWTQARVRLILDLASDRKMIARDLKNTRRLGVEQSEAVTHFPLLRISQQP